MGFLRDKGGSDAPGGLPCFLMVATDAEADLTIGLEAAVWGREAEARWPKRICWRQDYTAMVYTLAIWRIRRPSKGEMPFKEIRLQRFRSIVRRRRI